MCYYQFDAWLCQFMLIWSLLQYPPILESSKLSCPRSVALATCLPSLDWLAVSESLSSLPTQSIVACIKPPHPICHLFFPLIHKHDHLPSSAHFLIEPRLRTTLASRGFQYAEPRVWNSTKWHQTCSFFLFVQIQTQTHLFTSTRQ